MTRNPMSRLDLLKRWDFRCARVERECATGLESTTAWRIHEVWDSSGDDVKFLLVLTRNRDGPDEALGVRMQGMVEDRIDAGDFGNGTGVHDGNPAAVLGDNPEVVSDQ